ncbi:MAG: hypothetical protein AAF376_20415 [Pseudomonadota bacterium]
MVEEEKVACRTPEGSSAGTRIPAWKYHAVRAAILDAIRAAGPEGMRNKDLNAAVEARLTVDELARLGKLGWHVVTVKLEMEVRGEIARIKGRSPLTFVLTG